MDSGEIKLTPASPRAGLLRDPRRSWLRLHVRSAPSDSLVPVEKTEQIRCGLRPSAWGCNDRGMSEFASP